MSLFFIKKTTWIPNPKRERQELIPMEEVPGPKPHPLTQLSLPRTLPQLLGDAHRLKFRPQIHRTTV